MSPILCPSKCDNLEAEKRNNIAVAIAGVLFFTGWWVIIDVAASNPTRTEFDHRYYLCGLFGTLALFMVNVVTKSQLRGDLFAEEGFLYLGPVAAWFWLFVGFFMAFASVIAACWVLIGGYLIQSYLPNKWPGGAVFLQNILIFASSMVCKFGRSDEF